jgi:hypothetical protein
VPVKISSVRGSRMANCPVENCKDINEIKEVLRKRGVTLFGPDGRGGLVQEMSDLKAFVNDKIASCMRRPHWAITVSVVLFIFGSIIIPSAINIINLGKATEIAPHLYAEKSVVQEIDKTQQVVKQRIESISENIKDIKETQQKNIDDVKANQRIIREENRQHIEEIKQLINSFHRD